MFFSDFAVDDKAVHEWLSWGGIYKYPFVLRQKDGSYFTVIKYDEYERTDETIVGRNFKNGWAVWSETQCVSGEYCHYLTVLFNPFLSGDGQYVTNTLQNKVAYGKELDHFVLEMEKLLSDMNTVTEARFLEYGELMDFLSFTLSLGEDFAEMPPVPLYFDVLLSQNLKIDFKENDIFINGKRVFVLSLPSMPDVTKIAEGFSNYSWRYVRRLLIFSPEAAVKDMKKYAVKWASGRNVIKEYVLRDILGGINGYYAGSFIFLLDEKDYDDVYALAEQICQTEQIPYVIESFNLKDVWWGSLPGLFRANVVPPVVGFDSVEDLLWLRHEKEIEEENIFKETLVRIGEDEDDSATGFHIFGDNDETPAKSVSDFTDGE